MTLYEERMKEVKDNDKVVFYDYLLYKNHHLHSGPNLILWIHISIF